MSDLKFEFIGATIRQRNNCIVSLKLPSDDHYKYAYIYVKGKRAVQLLKKKERIDIGFTKDGSKIAFSPSDMYGYKYRISGQDSTLRFKAMNSVIYDFIKKNEGEYNARFTDNGIVYADINADKQLRETISDEDIDMTVEEPVQEIKKIEESKHIEPSTPSDVVSNGSKVFVATFDCLCRQCGQPIKVIMRAGQKGKPVNPNLEYFARSEYGTKTFVTTDGITVRGIPYSKKAKGMQEGYQAHWETCAANNSGRK